MVGLSEGARFSRRCSLFSSLFLPKKNCHQIFDQMFFDRRRKKMLGHSKEPMSTLTNPTQKRRRSQAQILVDEARVFLDRPTVHSAVERPLWQQMIAREQRLERARTRKRRRNRLNLNRAKNALTRGLHSAASLRDALGARPFTLMQQFGGGAWQKYRSIPLRLNQFDYRRWVSQQSTQLKKVMMRQLGIHNNYRVFAKASANFIDTRPIGLRTANGWGDNSISMERLIRWTAYNRGGFGIEIASP